MSSGKHCEAASKLDFSITTFIQLITKLAYCITDCSHYFIVYTTLKNHISRSPYRRPSLASPQLLTVAGMHSMLLGVLLVATLMLPPERCNTWSRRLPSRSIGHSSCHLWPCPPVAHTPILIPTSTTHPMLIVGQRAPHQAAAHVCAARAPGTRTFRYRRHVLYSDAFLRRSLHHRELSSAISALARDRKLTTRQIPTLHPGTCRRVVHPGRMPRTRSSSSALERGTCPTPCCALPSSRVRASYRSVPSRRSHSAPVTQSSHARASPSASACRPSRPMRTELRAADRGNETDTRVDEDMPRQPVIGPRPRGD